MRKTGILTLLAIAGCAAAAPLSRPAIAAPVKKPVAPAPGVKGTAQLPGDIGQVGVTYTLNGGETYNLTIRSIYFVDSRLVLHGATFYPDGDKKFLVVDYTVQNPNSNGELGVRWDRFKLTAVDATNQNYDQSGESENTTTHGDLDISLKPGQKVECRQYLVVPADRQVPKLMLDYSGPKVMRFDLHGVAKVVEPLLHDPADPTGALALATINPAKLGVTYPCGQFDITVESLTLSTAALAGNAPDDGKQYLIATVRVKNAMTKDDVDFNNGNGFTAFVMDSDGDKIDRAGDYLKASSDDTADTSIPTGIEKRFRIYFPVPKSGGLKTLTLSEGDSYRKLVYDLSGVH